MRVGVIQSNYIPWLGYFDFIASVDVFVFHDDVQYTKQDWRNRNLVRVGGVSQWVTVPVRKHATHTAIDRIEIAGDDWRGEHASVFERAFGKAPFYREALALWLAVTEGQTMLSEMNQDLIGAVCARLDISVPFVNSRDLGLTGAKTERLLQMLKALGASTYLSGPAARDYLDEGLLADHGITVEWLRYRDHDKVTVLDAIARHGMESIEPVRLAA